MIVPAGSVVWAISEAELPWLRFAGALLVEKARVGGQALPASIVQKLAELEEAIGALSGPQRSADVPQTCRCLTADIPTRVDAAVMSTKAAASRLKVGERAVRARLERGSLPGRKVAGRWEVFVDQAHDDEEGAA